MLRHMRTTIRLDGHLMKQLKRLAAESHRTLTAVIEDAVREVIARSKKKSVKKHVDLPTFSGQGLQAGVDLDHTSGLLDIMEGR